MLNRTHSSSLSIVIRVALVVFIVLPVSLIIGYYFDWIDVSESVSYERLSVQWTCGIAPSKVEYWKGTTLDEVSDILSRDYDGEGAVLNSGQPLTIATLSPSTFKGIGIGEKWVVLRVQSEGNETIVWKAVITVDEKLLESGVVRIPCPSERVGSDGFWNKSDK